MKVGFWKMRIIELLELLFADYMVIVAESEKEMLQNIIDTKNIYKKIDVEMKMSERIEEMNEKIDARDEKMNAIIE